MDTLIKTGEEYKTDQTQTRPNYHYSKKTSSSNYDYMDSLPIDVIFEILVRVPARDVHNSTRLVCRKWHNITRTRDFKHAHLHQSTCGLLSYGRRQQHMTFIDSKADDDDMIEISKLSYGSQHNVLSSCNGLLLQASRDRPRHLYITNPATERSLDLPPFSFDVLVINASAMAYVATTMEYKVVRPFSHRLFKPEANCVAILTLGVDKDWTCRVNTQHLSRKAKGLFLIPSPLTTQCFVHWALDETSVTWARHKIHSGYVLTLNLETEIFTQFPVPSLRRSHEKGKTDIIYLPMGSFLSLLILRSKFSWELWEMKPETGEWTEMLSIDLLEDEFVRNSGKKLRPVGWLRPREVLVFSARNFVHSATNFAPPIYYAFTVRIRKLQELKLDGGTNSFLVHRNSLVWIN